MLKFIKTWYRHKRLVWKFGRKLKLGWWQLLIHDLSKLYPTQLLSFLLITSKINNGWLWRTFNQRLLQNIIAYGVDKHVHSEPHHWEYWCRVEKGESGLEVKKYVIPDNYVREMAADWLAARIEYDGLIPKSLEDWPVANEMLEKGVVYDLNKMKSYLNELLSCIQTLAKQ